MITSLRQTGTCLAAIAVLATAGCGGGGSGGNDRGRTTPATNQPPSARISASDADGFAPLTVTFEAGESNDPDGTIASYQWDFGDDSPAAEGASVSHTFTDTGSFTVTLQVSDNGGLTASAVQTVRARGATVSGTIRIAAGSSVDSDVNDRLTNPVSNNGFGSAQPVSNPLRLGGFVNLPGTGAANGNFRDSGDAEDIFAIELEGNEQIVLSIGDPSADLDLELYSDAAEPELIDASVSQDPTHDGAEDLLAPAAPGRYFVRVVAAAGASTYVLRVDEDTPTPAARRHAKRLTDPFVPGEVLLAETAHSRLGRYGVEPAHAGVGLRLQALQRAGATGAGLRVPEVTLAAGASVSPAMRRRYETLQAARNLGARTGVHLAELNVLRQPLRQPDDEFYDRQWHFRAIGLEQAWDVTTGEISGRSPIVIAVVDTGVLLEHPDLRNQLLRDPGGQVVGYDFVQDPGRANDGDGIDRNPDDPGDNALGAGEGSFHGSHVAGIAAAQTNNAIGVAGVAWAARIMPLRALGVDGGTTFDVLQAVRYAAGLDNVSGTTPPVRADIVNMSLGSDFYSEAEQQALNEVRARGIFVVASAGNDSSRVPSYPASYDGVLSVAAVGALDNVAGYSNFGPHIDVAAPGGDSTVDQDGDGHIDGIASTIGTGGADDVQFAYGVLDGTSMAAPHLSGVIALMKSVHPDLTPGEFDILLQAGGLTADAGPPGRDDRYGWGIIDAFEAVQSAVDLRGGDFGPIISPSTATLDFQAFIRQLDFAVTNIGDKPANIELVEEAPWLSVTRITATDDGFGEYRATVDRGNLAEGSYKATILIRAVDVELVQPGAVNVIMQVVAPDPNADAGQHYVILLDPAEEQSLAAQIVTARNGQYLFDLRDVPAGEYRIFAGTDLDDDNFICDGGEACGAFPSLASPEIITIDPAQQPEVADLTFASEFRTTATTTSAGRTGGADEGLRMDKPDSN